MLGARSVKWVNKITVSAEQAYSPWQRGIAYRGFGSVHAAPPARLPPVRLRACPLPACLTS